MTPRTNGLSLDSFKNILKLEQAHDYDNTAVIGGLDGFIQRWYDELNALFQQQSDAQALLLCSYDDLNSAKREDLVKRWLRLLINT